MQRLNDVDRLLVISGGSGAGWALSLLDLHCRQRSISYDGEIDSGSASQSELSQIFHKGNQTHRSLRMILATRESPSRSLFSGSVSRLLSDCSGLPSPSDVSEEIYLTAEAQQVVHGEAAEEEFEDLTKSSDNIKLVSQEEKAGILGKDLLGRPDLSVVNCQEDQAAAAEHSALKVYVCGPLTMQNGVRNAVARENADIIQGARVGCVYLHSEHFSWA